MIRVFAVIIGLTSACAETKDPKFSQQAPDVEATRFKFATASDGGCPAGTTIVGRYCHPQCAADRDCPDGLLCYCRRGACTIQSKQGIAFDFPLDVCYSDWRRVQP